MKGKVLKTLFVIPSLSGGGAERILLEIIKNLTPKKFQPQLVLFERRGPYLSQLPSEVKVYDLKKRRRIDFLKLVIKLAYIIAREKPDIILSFLTYANLIAILAKKFSFSKSRLIISERSLASLQIKNQRLSRIKTFLINKLYPYADRIVAVSQGVKRDLMANFEIEGRRIEVIYNGLDIKRIKKLSLEAVNHNLFENRTLYIIGIGRLTKLKGFQFLLKAFKLVREKHKGKLLLLGEGEEFNNLESLCRALSIEKEVAFLGFQDNPYKYLARSNIFVLSSLWEGFGNVIIEAMACGIPVIATRCPYGPEEIITDGVNGLLVPVGDVNALAEAILRLLDDEPLRRRLGEAGRRRAEDFDVQKMVSRYEMLFERISEENRNKNSK